VAGEHQVYLGLGANLGDRRANIERGLALLAEGGVVVEQVSALRPSAPVGGPEQPWFLNGAARAATALAPLELLALVKGIERRLGRRPGGPRWGPRPLDLDILLYDDITLDRPELVLPHPRMALRSFVLEPLVEVLR